MTAEEEWLYDLCFDLRKTPAEVLDCTTVDLLRLRERQLRRWNDRDKRDWYAAQQAYETFAVPFRVWGKKVPPEFTVKSFLMKFDIPDSEKQAAKFDADAQAREQQTYVQMQKTYWMVGLGLDPTTGKPVDDGIPVKTQLPPDMDGMTGISAVNGHPGAVPAVVAAPPGPRQGGWTPKGRKRR